MNGESRQRGDLADQIWTPEETLAFLSTFVVLAPGDLVFTGTPAGVGRLEPGDEFEASIEGIAELSGTIVSTGFR